jgi:tetratricopeptide (TPR) repeat protein
MAGPVNSVFELRILVQPGSGGGMPPHAVRGEALCYVGASDHLEAFGIAVRELNARGVIVEKLVDNSVGLLDLTKWQAHAQEVSRHASMRFGDTAESARERLPDRAGLRRLEQEGGFLLGLFFCWDSDADPGLDSEPWSRDGPGLSSEEVERHDALFKQGYALIEDLVYVENSSRTPPEASHKKRLRKAIKAFEQALGIIPTNWHAMVLIGKAFQSLGEHDHALDAFLRAHDCAPGELIVALEAGSSAGRVGRHDVAIRIMETAAGYHPADPRLPFNLSLSYLFVRDFAKARAAIARANELEPGRDENKRLLALLIDAESGVRPCPSNETEVARALS